MTTPTDDLRILALHELSTPAAVIGEFPRSDGAASTVAATRAAVHQILHGTEDRLIVVIGPCSVHDPSAALDYAQRLASVRQRLSESLDIIMRVYFEKPRTTIGWKGLINDPRLDGSFDIDRGLRIARDLLLKIGNLGVPAGCEFLETTTPQYIADLVAWAAIGARTTESQVHREMASGLSCPPRSLTISWRLPRRGVRRSQRPRAIPIATSSYAGVRRQTTMPPASPPPPRWRRAPACRRLS